MWIDGYDGAVGFELQAVDAHLAVDARRMVAVRGIDAMVDANPFVGVGQAEHGVVGRTEYVVFLA